MNRRAKGVDCGGTTPLFLHATNFQAVQPIHRAAKAESCLRSPKFRFVAPKRVRMRVEAAHDMIPFLPRPGPS